MKALQPPCRVRQLALRCCTHAKAQRRQAFTKPAPSPGLPTTNPFLFLRAFAPSRETLCDRFKRDRQNLPIAAGSSCVACHSAPHLILSGLRCHSERSEESRLSRARSFAALRMTPTASSNFHSAFAKSFSRGA